MKLRESIFTKQIETDRNVQTVWCEYAWKMSVNSKGSTLSYVCISPNDDGDNNATLTSARQLAVKLA